MKHVQMSNAMQPLYDATIHSIINDASAKSYVKISLKCYVSKVHKISYTSGNPGRYYKLSGAFL